MFVAILIFLLLLTGTALYFSLRLNLKNQDKLQSINEQVEKSLDILDECYQRAASRATLEVLSDEPVVRGLIDDIKTTRDAILLVANLITRGQDDAEERNAE